MDESMVSGYKLDRTGLARLFGHLEAEVMEALWALGQGTVSAVRAQIDGTQQYTTLQTVMNRLEAKGVLDRVGRVGGAVIYRPVIARQRFIEHTSRRLVASLLSEFGDAAARGVLDAVGDLDVEQLDALEAVIRERRSSG